MRLRLIVASALLICGNAGISAINPASSDRSSDKLKGVPLRDVAAPLREVWLRFHEENLCLGVDSIFVFHARGIEIWCRIKDERNYQQLAALVEPLRKSYRIELYATHADREKKASSILDEDPPPSFWTNAELRSYLRDPFFIRFGSRGDRAQDVYDDSEADPELKRRLKLYGDQILEWLNKMVQLAIDLPSLAGAAYGDDIIPDIRNRARAVCSDHSREVGKCAVRLAESLSHALPRGTVNTPSAQPSKESRPASASPHEGALLVSQQAQDLERRILLFLYPQAHTVTLDDLREPSLIDSLKTLQQTVSDFESSARKDR
jgi:hypothetical protein